MSSEKKPGYAHFCDLENQPITKRSGSARDDAAAGRNGKSNPYKKKIKSLRKIYSPEKNSPWKKSTEKKSSVRPMGNCTNRKGRNATSIGRTSAKVLPCETIGTESAKSNNGENSQINNEDSVHPWNNVKQPYPVIVNCLGFKLGDIDLLKMRRGRKPKISQSVTAPLKGFVVMEKNSILGSKNRKPSSPTSGRGNSANEKSGDKLNCMDNGADSSFKPRDHDDLTDHPDPLGCKNTKVNSVEDNRNSAGEHQNTYQAASLPLPTNNKCQVHGGNRNVIDYVALEREDEEIRPQQDCRVSTELQQRIITANVTQPSSLENGVADKVTLHSSNMGVLPE